MKQKVSKPRRNNRSPLLGDQNMIHIPRFENYEHSGLFPTPTYNNPRLPLYPGPNKLPCGCYFDPSLPMPGPMIAGGPVHVPHSQLCNLSQPIQIPMPSHHPAPMMMQNAYTPPEYHSTMSISQQIEYYFSEKNLRNDFYLRSKMDKKGFVDLNIIAGFKRIAMQTKDLSVLEQCVMESNIVTIVTEEIDGRVVKKVGPIDSGIAGKFILKHVGNSPGWSII